MWAFRLSAPAVLDKVSAGAPGPQALLDGQVMVKLAAGGLCGSDLPFFRGARNDVVPMDDESDYSMTPIGVSMHEIVGEVVASRDTALRTGAKVVGWATGMNGLAEYVVTDGASLAEYDPALAAGTAVMLQPLACVLYAVDQMGQVEGVDAAVLGLGPIGLLFAHVLRSRGASSVVGVDRVSRSEVADLFGLDRAVHASCDRWAAGIHEGAQPGLVVEAIGHQVGTLASAISAVAPQGEVHYFGVPDDDWYPLNMHQLIRKHLTLRSGTTLDRRNYLLQAGEYLRRYPDLMNCYVTDVYPVAEAQRAFESAIAPAAGRLKIVLEV
ncbi:zinc-binding dehydrogenase [Amycolatopsis sp. K13G38]|uniref:Zinc-binding dehydrogenase n=2 Tax=Amycolatopsis acididurans TaxID=2724524 RepID=A0ABX1JC29_9PSEU|nr:zinc-binding dehydrogenase [Amycolatopsis acididurans]